MAYKIITLEPSISADSAPFINDNNCHILSTEFCLPAVLCPNKKRKGTCLHVPFFSGLYPPPGTCRKSCCFLNELVSQRRERRRGVAGCKRYQSRFHFLLEANHCIGHGAI